MVRVIMQNKENWLAVDTSTGKHLSFMSALELLISPELITRKSG
jgi:hypothetical protein